MRLLRKRRRRSFAGACPYCRYSVLEQYMTPAPIVNGVDDNVRAESALVASLGNEFLTGIC